MGVEFNLNRYYLALGFDQGEAGAFGAVRYAGRAAGACLLPVATRHLGLAGRLAAGLVVLGLSTWAQAFVGSAETGAFGAFAFGMANGWNDVLSACWRWRRRTRAWRPRRSRSSWRSRT